MKREDFIFDHSSWGNGEDSVTIETMNTIYVLTKQ